MELVIRKKMKKRHFFGILGCFTMLAVYINCFRSFINLFAGDI